MKKLFTLVLISAFSIMLSAQAPQKLSYQAVIRNSTGGLVTNHAVGMKISILQGTSNGTPVYVETHTTTTNANGLATIEIGGGNLVSGTFTDISWGSGNYYNKTETDPSGGTNYTIDGTSPLLSVPYALDAKTSESVINNSITSAKIVDGAISSSDLGNNSITSAKISDGTIATADLASSSVTTDKINAGAVTSSKLSATGGSSGQVLKLSGTALAWGSDNVGGLSLPYSGSGSTTGSTDLFYLQNLGTGRCIQAFAESNTAIWGRTTSGYAGIDGRNSSGHGVSGHSESGYGVYGRSTSGYGVYGIATSTFGYSNAGVYGESKSPDGYGIYGKSDVGVKGVGESIGVDGEATGSNNAFGIVAKVSSASGNSVYAVYATCESESGYSGFFGGGKFHVSGKVGIGTTTPAYKLQVGVAADGTTARANAWNTFSDARLKKDMTVIKNPIDLVRQINGCYFYWNTGTDKERQVGFSAQGILEIFPEVVSKGEDGYLSLDYGKITPLLVEAIKQLKTENDDLKTRLEMIEKSLNSGLK